MNRIHLRQVLAQLPQSLHAGQILDHVAAELAAANLLGRDVSGEAALALGAEVAIEESEEALRSLSESAWDSPFDLVVEAVGGQAPAIKEALAGARMNGYTFKVKELSENVLEAELVLVSHNPD